VSCESLWLWDSYSLGSQEGEGSLLEPVSEDWCGTADQEDSMPV
jgi:hypothetical protein